MNIKERIKTIIEDYSFIERWGSNVRNNIKRTYKGLSSNLKPLGLCKRPYFT